VAESRPIVSNSVQAKDSLSGVIAGRFRITERLGKGGMGEVYRAEDMRLKRTVALKRLAPQLQADSLYRHRFQEEAERVSRFSDIHIAAVYDVLEEQGESILVMEYVEGQTLRQRLLHSLTLEEFFDIACQCAEALVAAHERGVVHCDIKPENIMLTTTGQVKILDFGVAKHLPRSDQSSTVEPGGSAGGTPAYMSPEVLLERAPDGRADIFSLAVVFYELLARQHPFLAGSFVATTDRIRHETPASVRIFNPKVPEALDALVLRAIAKEPCQRYANARELLNELHLVQAGVTPSAMQRVLPRREPAKLGWMRWKVATVAVIVVLMIIVAYRQPQIRRWLHLGESSVPIHLAVLPFTSTGSDPGTKAFCDGLTETLAAKLTQLTGNYPLQVVPTSEVRDEGISSVEQARRDFGVNFVLEGSLHSAGDEVRVTYSLVDAETRRQVHAGTIDGHATDVFGVEDRVVDGVLGMLGLEIQTTERVVLAAHGTRDPSAYDQYLRGRGYLLDYHKPENIDSAIASFNRALSLDPKYAQAYAALGQAYRQGYQEGQHGNDWMEKARSACEQSVSAAPRLADGHTCLGRVYRGTGEYEKAVVELQKATALDATSDDAYRGLADAYQKLNKPAEAEATYRQAIRLRPQYWAGYSWLGSFYYQQGRFDDAIYMFRQVVSLAPDNFRGYSNLGAMYVLEGRYQEGIGVLEKSIAIRPTAEAYNNLGNAYFSLRRFEAAGHSFEGGLKLDKTSWLGWGNLADANYWTPGKQQQAMHAYREAIRLADEKLRMNPRDGFTLAYRATYLAMTDQKDEALASLQSAVSLSPKDPDVRFRGALVYNHLGETDQTLAWLQQALSLGVVAASVRNTPDFDHLREDARLQHLLQGH
jgi:tetratricopeptide (TPR) repeat protein/TolB-like protein